MWKRIKRSRRIVGRGKRAAPRRFGRSAKRRRSGPVAFGSKRIVKLRTAGIMPVRKFVACEYRACNRVFSPSPPSTQSVHCGLIGGYYYRCNSVYDPDPAITGLFNNASTLHNFYSNFYGKYRVVRAHAVFTLRQTNILHPDLGSDGVTGDHHSLKWGVFVDDDADGSLGPWTSIVSRPSTILKTIVPNANGDARSTIKINWNESRISNYRDQNLSVVAGNPAHLNYFMPFWAHSTHRSGEAYYDPAFELDVYIRYDVCYIQPKDIEDLTGTVSLIQA